MEKLFEFFNKNLNLKNGDLIELEHKGGRVYKYDFLVIINKVLEHKFEFKYNCKSIIDYPQIVNIVRPDKYLDINFQEWYYDNYFDKIVNINPNYNLVKPDKNQYLSEVNNNNPKCLQNFLEIHKCDKDWNKKCRNISKQAITEFIQKFNLNINELTNYLKKDQIEKKYILYKKGSFYYDKLDDNTFTLKENIYRNGVNYIVETDNNNYNLQFKLRFKNREGLAFPAFQVKVVKNIKDK